MFGHSGRNEMELTTLNSGSRKDEDGGYVFLKLNDKALIFNIKVF